MPTSSLQADDKNYLWLFEAYRKSMDKSGKIS